jgi:hypothetical protein
MKNERPIYESLGQFPVSGPDGYLYCQRCGANWPIEASTCWFCNKRKPPIVIIEPRRIRKREEDTEEKQASARELLGDIFNGN